MTTSSNDNDDRLVHQRTRGLKSLRRAYIEDVVAIKAFLEAQKVGCRGVTPLPEELRRMPSADLRGMYRSVVGDMETRSRSELMTTWNVNDFLPSSTFPLLDVGDTRVNDLTLGIYAPSDRAIVIKPCAECLGIAAFVYQRNSRVDRALGRLDRLEFVEGEIKEVKDINTKLLER
ncbi:unnamed protein product, partial [Choristocarpus tenellus]